MERLHLMLQLGTRPEDVLGEASHVRGVELDRLRRAVLEIAGQHVSELQARKRVRVDWPVASVDTRGTDASLEPVSISLTEKVALPSDHELDLHILTLARYHERVQRRHGRVEQARAVSLRARFLAQGSVPPARRESPLLDPLNQYRCEVLAEPAQALTDLALGVVTMAFAVQLHRSPTTHPHWCVAFWWFGIAALAGAVHHGTIVRWPQEAHASWAVISVAVVIAVSYLLAATVAEVLGPGRARAFWSLRSVGVVAYVAVAASGHAGIGAILACESLTMISVLGLWLWAAYHNHPLARPMLLAIAASLAAAAVHAPHADVLQPLGLDPTSAYHLGQIVGIVLLYLAVSGLAGAGVSSDSGSARPATLAEG